MPIGKCIVVGDGVWDLLAARGASALGVGLLSEATVGRTSNGRVQLPYLP